MADLAGLAGFDRQAERLEQLRLRTREALVEIRLPLGEHRALIPELAELSRQPPLDEQIHGS